MDSGSPSPNRNIQATQILVWWVLWGTILCGLILIYVFLGRRAPVQPHVTSGAAVIDYVAIGPLVLSSVIRWLWFPRIEKMQQPFVVFIMGIALAESTGIMGTILTQQALMFTLLGALGIVQWIPLYAGKYPPIGPSPR